jgi:hypothetical protein
MTSLYTYTNITTCVSHHRSIMHSKIILLNKRGYQLNIYLVVIGSILYLIIIQQDHQEFIINIDAITINTPQTLL